MLSADVRPSPMTSVISLADSNSIAGLNVVRMNFSHGSYEVSLSLFLSFRLRCRSDLLTFTVVPPVRYR